MHHQPMIQSTSVCFFFDKLWDICHMNLLVYHKIKMRSSKNTQSDNLSVDILQYDVD